MNIAINALSVRAGSGVSVITNLLPRLVALGPNHRYTLFYTPWQQGVAQAIPSGVRGVPIRSLPRNPYLRVLWEQVVFPCYVFLYRIDVLYSVGNTTSLLAPCTVVLLMENANPYSRLDLPWSARERLRNRLLRILGALSARRATTIRFVSENSRKLIAPRLGVPATKCVVIPHGVAPQMLSAERADAVQAHPDRRYVLTVGVNGPHRNTVRLLKAFALLLSRDEYPGDLIVLGHMTSVPYRRTVEQLVGTLGLSARVLFKGEIPHRSVGSYYRHADAFVFPSLEETFGIPLIEAMGFGVPIVTSDGDLDVAHFGRCFTPFREICGPAAHYVNPFEVEDIAAGLQRVITDARYREQLIANGTTRVRRFNLGATAQALLNLFDTAFDADAAKIIE